MLPVTAADDDDDDGDPSRSALRLAGVLCFRLCSDIQNDDDDDDDNARQRRKESRVAVNWTRIFDRLFWVKRHAAVVDAAAAAAVFATITTTRTADTTTTNVIARSIAFDMRRILQSATICHHLIVSAKCV